ncbi:hypothetical protein DFH27DRAFT_582183 [Peziza echinospora]|nr:hypothetical protein DFH27DRAFT_582183 [Peziza echinospora]
MSTAAHSVMQRAPATSSSLRHHHTGDALMQSHHTNSTPPLTITFRTPPSTTPARVGTLIYSPFAANLPALGFTFGCLLPSALASHVEGMLLAIRASMGVPDSRTQLRFWLPKEGGKEEGMEENDEEAEEVPGSRHIQFDQLVAECERLVGCTPSERQKGLFASGSWTVFVTMHPADADGDADVESDDEEEVENRRRQGLDRGIVALWDMQLVKVEIEINVSQVTELGNGICMDRASFIPKHFTLYVSMRWTIGDLRREVMRKIFEAQDRFRPLNISVGGVDRAEVTVLRGHKRKLSEEEEQHVTFHWLGNELVDDRSLTMWHFWKKGDNWHDDAERASPVQAFIRVFKQE